MKLLPVSCFSTVFCPELIGLPGSASVKNLPDNAGDVRDVGSIPGLGRSPGGGNDNSFQYSSLENPMDRGAWQVIVHRLVKSQTRLKQLSTGES